MGGDTHRGQRSEDGRESDREVVVFSIGVCVLQGVAGCCRVLQGVAGCCIEVVVVSIGMCVLQGVAGCCRVLQGVAGCCIEGGRESDREVVVFSMGVREGLWEC